MKPIKRHLNSIVNFLRTSWHFVGLTIRRGLHMMHRAYLVISTRHVRRWAGDSNYRRTVLAAVTVLTATVLPHPALAAALSAAVGEWTPTRFERHVDFYDDDDQFDPHGRQLWDTYA